MIQSVTNTKPLNYFNQTKMINHLETKRELVKVQRDELERIKCLNRLLNQNEIRYIKRLVQEKPYKTDVQ